MSVRSVIVTIFGEAVVPPTLRVVAEVIKLSQKQREKNREQIDRARKIATEFERMDGVLG